MDIVDTSIAREHTAHADSHNSDRHIGIWCYSGEGCSSSYEVKLVGQDLQFNEDLVDGTKNSGKLNQVGEWLEAELVNGTIRLKLLTETSMQSNFKPRSQPEWQSAIVSTKAGPTTATASSASARCVDPRLAAANLAYENVWRDFLMNRREQAEQKAALLLKILEEVPEVMKDADAWLTEADFRYICGAIQKNHRPTLESAMHAYDRAIALLPTGSSTNARRMRAETLLRLHMYREAFQAFMELSTLSASDVLDDVYSPSFRLRHDARVLRRLGQAGRVATEMAEAAAGKLCTVATRIESGAVAKGIDRPKVADLSPQDATLLQEANFDEMWRFLPKPNRRFTVWEEEAHANPCVLNNAADWGEVENAYCTTGIAILDDFFSAEALGELWQYSMESPCFRTVRAGFLGAFPADGFVHPIIQRAALELEQRMPQVLDGHPLGLWWLFKYTDQGRKGIGIHADQAAVNFNIWLTPDKFRRSGGGLDVFTQQPPEEASVRDYNQEFATAEEEAEFRSKLEVGGVRHVEYKQNRAVIFVSDLYHVSEPFEFPDCDEGPRVNLTLLFGDRAAARERHGMNKRRKPNSDVKAVVANTVSAVGVEGVGNQQDVSWDLFD